ncbi:MAG: 1-deoxy-D-xylulose-5-phosphate synthase [Planctomycetota bacterium]
MKTRIMYLENKSGGLTGPGRIGRVSFSQTGKTIYYRGQAFQSLKGRGCKSNYVEIATGQEYWISGPRKDGRDQLYGGGNTVSVDEDVAEEYWSTLRTPAKSVSAIQ